MSFQKCPSCNGNGTVNTYSNLSGTSAANFNITCLTCNGEKILSEQNGLPPSRQSLPSEEKELTIADCFCLMEKYRNSPFKPEQIIFDKTLDKYNQLIDQQFKTEGK